MLYTPEGLKKKDSRIAFRTPNILRQTLSWFAEKNLRSENQEAEVLLLEILREKAIKEERIFLEWKIKVKPAGIGFLLHIMDQRGLPVPNEDKVKEAITKIRQGEISDEFSTFITYKTSPNPNIPMDLVPFDLGKVMHGNGINPYKLPPDLYVFESSLLSFILSEKEIEESPQEVFPEFPCRHDVSLADLFPNSPVFLFLEYYRKLKRLEDDLHPMS